MEADLVEEQQRQQHFVNISIIEPPRLFHPLRANLTLIKMAIYDDDDGNNVLPISIIAQLEYRESPKNTLGKVYEGHSHEIIATTRLANWTTLLDHPLLEFPCWHFSLPGEYRLSIWQRGKGKEELKIGSSPWLPLAHSSSPSSSSSIHPLIHPLPHLPPPHPAAIPPSLHLPAPSALSIFPSCRHQFPLRWVLPVCGPQKRLAAKMDFRLRLFASEGDNVDGGMMDGGAEEAGKFAYLEEFLLEHSGQNGSEENSGILNIPCAQFDIIHEFFCFELVSISKQNRHYQLWDRKCVRTEPAASSADAFNNYWEWAEWSEWSKCSCERKSSKNGIRKRTRYCRRLADKFAMLERTTVGPSSRGEGKHHIGLRQCRRGEILQKHKCPMECAGAQKRTSITSPIGLALLAENASSSSSSPPSTNEHENCRCGCHLNNQLLEGIFFASAHSCPPNGQFQWILDYGRPFLLHINLIFHDQFTQEYDGIFSILGDNENDILWSSSEMVDKNDDKDGGMRRRRKRMEEGEKFVELEQKFRRRAIFELTGTNGRRQKGRRGEGGGGIYAHFKVDHFPIEADSSMLLWAQICEDRDNLSGQICPIILSFFSLIFALSLFAIPPLLCAWASRKWIRKRGGKKGSRGQQVYIRADGIGDDSAATMICSSVEGHNECRMFQSDQTQSTQLSDSLRMKNKPAMPPFLGQRSIGIQLSRQSTPRCCVSRQQRRNSAKGAADHSTNCGDSSLESAYWNEDDDFGADELQLGMARRDSNDGGGGPLARSCELIAEIDKIVCREMDIAWRIMDDGVEASKADEGKKKEKDAFSQF